MKIIFKAGFFLFNILILLNFSHVQGYEKPAQVIVTDKPYYSVEDTIRYAVLGLEQMYQDTVGKDIYYVELWNSENQLLYRHIHRIKDQIIYGSFFVSPDQNPGWRTIRAYSQRSLRNGRPVQVHLPILVIHSELQEEQIRDSLKNGFSANKRRDDSLVELELKVDLYPENPETRNNIQCTVKLPDYFQKQPIIPLVASAYFGDFFPQVDYGIYNSNLYGSERWLDENGEKMNEAPSEGLMLKGMYELPEEDKSKVFAMVTLSHLGEDPGIMYNYTNLKHEFSFDLSDIQGDVSAYLSVLDGQSEKIRLLPDNVPELHLSYSILDRTEWLLPLLKYQRNRKIQKLVKENYAPLIQSDTVQSISIYDTTRIYSKADRSYNLSDYIAFENVKELIIEILPYVKIHEDNGRYNIYLVNNQNPDLDINSPLYLINGIPTRDADFIAGLDVSNIDIVEVLYSKEALYSFNWLGKGGILAIYTKTPVKVPNYKLHAIKGIYPDQGSYQIIESGDEMQHYTPQIEPMIYWNPQLKMDKKGQISFNFLAGDQTGQLNVCLFGIGPDGEIVHGRGVIEVSTFANKVTTER